MELTQTQRDVLEVFTQSKKTGVSIAGGMMPHSGFALSVNDVIAGIGRLYGRTYSQLSICSSLAELADKGHLSKITSKKLPSIDMYARYQLK